MRKKQLASLLVLAMVWLFGSGFGSLSESVNVGIANVVEPLTKSDIENLREMEEWENRCMANVRDYVTIRKEADSEAEAVGRLYKGDGADVLERGSEWTYVSSGDCEGYVANEYLAFDRAAKDVAARDCKFIATITADALKIRDGASEEAKTLDLVAMGETMNILREEGEWLVVEYGSKEAYINANYVTVGFEVGEAQTMEQIRAAEEAAEAARKKEELKKKYDAVAAHGNDVEVLATLIQLEAGNQPYEGQLAVGAVVMNRVRSSRYPNTIAAVITAPGQFPPASSARFQSVLASGPKASCMQAAQEAINGVSNIGSFTHFKSSRSSVNGANIVIAGHVFY